MQTLREDLASAFRHIRQRRAAAVAVVLMIAVGIGANTTVFGLLKATFDDPPFPAMDRLVVVRMTAVDEKRFAPDSGAHAVYNDLYAIYRELHDGFGNVPGSAPVFGSLMKRLLAIRGRAAAAHSATGVHPRTHQR